MPSGTEQTQRKAEVYLEYQTQQIQLLFPIKYSIAKNLTCVQGMALSSVALGRTLGKAEFFFL